MGRFIAWNGVRLVVAGVFLVLLAVAGWWAAGSRFVPWRGSSQMKSLQHGLEHLDREMDRRDKVIDELNAPIKPTEESCMTPSQAPA